MEKINLEEYLSNGIENIVRGIIKATVKNPKESLFILKYKSDSQKAAKIRKKYEQSGTHIPPFLIASIAMQCNLHCSGCYARENHSCHDENPLNEKLLSLGEWERIFDEAQELGTGFILLAGGEPFYRTDIIRAAAKHKKIIFPVFTNGTLITENSLKLLDENRNIIPVISIEGDQGATDKRRGEGVYKKLLETMGNFRKKGIVFAASVTVTSKNFNEVYSKEFVQNLSMLGCKGIFYVEYVPADSSTANLAVDDNTRNTIAKKLEEIRSLFNEMIFIAFPGDEKSSGGCLAAGRGFFHINALGNAEPCPFSPYSDTNLKNISLLEAIDSPLFKRLQENGNFENEHIGGCTLFAQKNEVEALLNEK